MTTPAFGVSSDNERGGCKGEDEDGDHHVDEEEDGNQHDVEGEDKDGDQHEDEDGDLS